MEARIPAKDKDKGREAKRRSVLKDLTGLNNRGVGRSVMIVKEKPKPLPLAKEKEKAANVTGKEHDSVRKRVNEWERERERLREMERLEIFGKERDEELKQAKKDEEQGDISTVTSSSLASTPETEQSVQVAKVAVRAVARVVPTSAHGM
jgi:hypothetical protein